jgi:hypothetical protein
MIQCAYLCAFSIHKVSMRLEDMASHRAGWNDRCASQTQSSIAGRSDARNDQIWCIPTQKPSSSRWRQATMRRRSCQPTPSRSHHEHAHNAEIKGYRSAPSIFFPSYQDILYRSSCLTSQPTSLIFLDYCTI